MFTLKIKMGNAAMLTGEDIARALREVARDIERNVGDEELNKRVAFKGKIRDINGNTVGEWRAR
jgi:hypothetical protein